MYALLPRPLRTYQPIINWRKVKHYFKIIVRRTMNKSDIMREDALRTHSKEFLVEMLESNSAAYDKNFDALYKAYMREDKRTHNLCLYQEELLNQQDIELRRALGITTHDACKTKWCSSTCPEVTADGDCEIINRLKSEDSTAWL